MQAALFTYMPYMAYHATFDSYEIYWRLSISRKRRIRIRHCVDVSLSPCSLHCHKVVGHFQRPMIKNEELFRLTYIRLFVQLRFELDARAHHHITPMWYMPIPDNSENGNISQHYFRPLIQSNEDTLKRCFPAFIYCCHTLWRRNS